jgi:hypothetical protein
VPPVRGPTAAAAARKSSCSRREVRSRAGSCRRVAGQNGAPGRGDAVGDDFRAVTREPCLRMPSIRSSSMHPPDTEPTTRRLSQMASIAPFGRRLEPHVLMTVTSSQRWPEVSHCSQLLSTSRSMLSMIVHAQAFSESREQAVPWHCRRRWTWRCLS